jgi:hypothetical protein
MPPLALLCSQRAHILSPSLFPSTPWAAADSGRCTDTECSALENSARQKQLADTLVCTRSATYLHLVFPSDRETTDISELTDPQAASRMPQLALLTVPSSSAPVNETDQRLRGLHVSALPPVPGEHAFATLAECIQVSA